MKEINRIVLIMVVLCIAIFLTLISMFSSFHQSQSMYKNKLGQKIVISKDTLIIIDYSLIAETFTLSNGADINSSIVFSK